jgi:hypothetical protein
VRAARTGLISKRSFLVTVSGKGLRCPQALSIAQLVGEGLSIAPLD